MFDLNCLSLSSINENCVSTICGMGDEYFPRALDYVLTTESNMIEMKKEFSRCMLESNDNIVSINEGFSDYTSKIKSIIKKFLEFLKNLWDRFVRALASVVKSDKYLKKHKSLISSFDDTCNFDFEDYTWTFDEEVPSINIVSMLFTADLSVLEGLINDNNKDNGERLTAVKEKYKELMEKSTSGDYYDSIRASVIGKSGGKISKDDFNKELIKVFRNGADYKTNKTITPKDVTDAYDFFMNYNDSLKSVKQTKEKIEREYKDVMNVFSNHSSEDNKVSIDINSIEHTYTAEPEIIKYVNMYLKQKGDEIVTISNIHSLAFTAKMDAFKERFKSARKICYKAIAEVQKNKK